MKEKECRECLLKGKCVYSYVFETPPPIDTLVMRKYEAAPHPFVIEPPSGRKSVFKPGEELVFGLTLVGRAVDYMPYFIYTFDELGKAGLGADRGKYELKTVRSKAQTVKSEESGVGSEKQGHDEGRVIYSSETKMLTEFDTSVLDLPEGPLQATDAAPERLTLNFLTPTRIAYDGRLGLGLEFHIFIRNLLRRLSLLSYFHGNGKTLDLDFKGIIEMAKGIRAVDRGLRWYNWARYSGRQERRINMGGFVGKITFEGPLGPFMPFVKAGEVVHVGKGTVFGLGRYETR